MRQIICDGCKTGEELKGNAKAGKEIKQVKLEIWEDERESVPRPVLEADLCPKCRDEMRNKYFRGSIDTTEALLPESLQEGYIPVDEEEIEPTSLRA